ncbi:MAG: 30S ribosomal protein S9 [Candidatus Buchananbacteria bacterium]|nr:30S ribosomal protein S9 [Candidatus Buchananbacteria bacterium]
MSKKYIYGKGARKSSTAQVRLYEKGKGGVEVNGLKLKEYFKTEALRDVVVSPLKLTSHLKDLDVTIKVHSGGQQGQADACRHAMSRALVALDKELRPALKAEGFLTRDPRVKERKKPGLKRARKSPQWSKR